MARIVTRGPTRGSTRLVRTNRNAGERRTPRGTIRDRTRFSGRGRGANRQQPVRFVIAPLAPLVVAVAVGIVADRWFLAV